MIIEQKVTYNIKLDLDELMLINNTLIFRLTEVQSNSRYNMKIERLQKEISAVIDKVCNPTAEENADGAQKNLV